MFDYLIVGSGLFGSVCAHELVNVYGKSVLVVEKRNHIGGNVYTENRNGIHLHMYGPHIFHTSSEKIWKWINRFTKFNRYIHTPLINYKNEIYSLPINMFTFSKLWGVTDPLKARNIVESQSSEIYFTPRNLEEQAISLVGRDIYQKLIYGYTKKTWIKDPKDLPVGIINRLPLRYDFNNDYYAKEKYQGIPINGYTEIFEKMLDGIRVDTEVDYFENKKYLDSISKNVIYTGPIDKYFDYMYGKLDYKTTEFVHEHKMVSDFQGTSQINYSDENEKVLRVLEHKHFYNIDTDTTWISKEYPKKYGSDSEPYYPICDISNRKRYKKYKSMSEKLDNVYFGGRLAEFRYYDMHQVIGSALRKVSNWV